MLHVIASEGLLDLVRNAPHWEFELISDAVIGLAVTPVFKFIFRRWIKRHDATVHKEHS